MLLCLCTSSCQSTRMHNAYGFLKKASLKESEVASVRSGLPIDSIEVSSGGGMGAKSYTVIILNRDGTATKTVKCYAYSTETRYVGGVDIWDYGRLCMFIDESRFRTFEDFYDDGRTDSGGLYLSVKYRDGMVTKKVFGRYDLAPHDLWRIVRCTEGIGTDIEWKTEGEPGSGAYVAPRRDNAAHR